MNAPNDLVLAAAGVELDLGSRRVLDGATLKVRGGRISLLAGRNGAGKTTMLSVLAGLKRPARGRVTLQGVDVHALSARERARRIAWIPQDLESPFEFTGREIVTMGRHPFIGRFSGPSAADHEAVDAALERVDAMDFASRSVRTLSGGERRRIAVARALATGAPVLLADEPTGDLDLEHALQLLQLFVGLARSGCAVLLTSHDLNLVGPWVDRAALLHEGRIVAEGAALEALAPERIETVFRVRAEDPDGYFPRAFRPLGPGGGR